MTKDMRATAVEKARNIIDNMRIIRDDIKQGSCSESLIDYIKNEIGLLEDMIKQK